MKQILERSTALVGLCLLAATGVQAAPDLQDTPTAPHLGTSDRASTPRPSAGATFGPYQVLPGSAGDAANASSGLSAQSARRVGPSPEEPGAGDTTITEDSILRNRITGEQASPTGSLALKLSGGNIYEIAARYDLSVERSAPNIDLYVVRARKAQDLVALRDRLRAEENIESVKIDVLDNMQKPM